MPGEEFVGRASHAPGVILRRRGARLLEVEVKAWADLEAARARLEALGRRAVEISVKEDLYFCAPEADPRTCDATRDRIVRVRVKDGAAVVTAKRRSVVGGVETNEEIELEVDPRPFRALLDYMGYRPFLEKRKETRSYAWAPGTNVELNRVAGLGDFVEVETLVDSATEDE